MSGQKTHKKASIKSTPLWDHQRKAINTIRKYLSAAKVNRNIGAALVHMPTGTGKSGVIAVSSHFLKNVGCVLLLCPRIALRDQLAREVGGRFFTKLNLDANSLPKKVQIVKRGFPKITTDEYSCTIFVMTIQMLHSWANRENEDYYKLKKHLDLLIIDEGHYEPAISWRDAIRTIHRPRIIFTATPFRNDLKLFDINYDYAFSYTFHDAVSDKIIRRVQIHPRRQSGTPRDFVKDVVNFYDKNLHGRGSKGEEPRGIIRCESQATIRQIGVALGSLGKSYVLIHENFDDDDKNRPHERRTVPNPDREKAIFWVHQFKLLEGIDDPRFQLLSLYEELRTTRSFVQQVGRVIRNPSRKSGAIAHVLDHSNGRQNELWEGFLGFDKLIKREGVKVADFGKKILEQLIKALPDVVYLNGRFRTPFTLKNIDPKDELYLPLTVNVFRKGASFNLKDLCNEIKSEYNQQDRVFRIVPVNTQTLVFLYLAFRNSPFLRSTCFVECRLGVTILREIGTYLCYFDSSGGVPDVLEGHAEQVPTEELRRLFSKRDRAYLTAVSLRNANLGPRVIRSRTIYAARIEDTVPTFDDHAFVCQTARGYSKKGNHDFVRRYVGFQRGKITDSSDARATFHEYMSWLNGITECLEKEDRNIATAFARYAKHADVPLDPEPISVLLDLVEVQDKFFTIDYEGVTAGESMIIEDVCSEVNNGSFVVKANGRQFAPTIQFKSATNRYLIDSPDLEASYYSNEDGLDRSLVHYLNNEQSFRVIPRSEGSFYTLGEFYSPIVRFGRRYDDSQFGLVRILYPAECLEQIGSEKGKNCLADSSGWDPKSLFAIIDKLGRGYKLDSLFGKPDILVCDDLETEAADFILADTDKRKVVFIHAKGKGKGESRKYAASPLQEICGQATKNLKYFSRYGNDEPPKARKWHTRRWTGAKGVSGKVDNRIRMKPNSISTGLQLWKMIRSIIRDPLADLQVWLFLGRMFSKSSFDQQLNADRSATEAQQAAYLLFSTMNDAASVGVKLRVICSP